MPSNPSIFPPENNLKQADFASITNDSLPQIVAQFNQENDSTKRSSILKNINFLGFSLFRYRMVEKNQVRLVQRNGVPELADYSGYNQRRLKIWSLWKPWTWFRSFRDNSSTIGVYNIAEIINRGHIGYGDRHLVNVSPGDYAKVIIDGNPILLNEGAHVIKTSNFSYIEKVSQSTNYIKHENLYRLQVPSAKIAAVIVNNEPHLLETGTYYIRSNNFDINQKVLYRNMNSYFYDNEDSVIACGSLLRIMPPPNTVAVYNIGSVQHIFPDNAAPSNLSKLENQVGIIDQNGILEIRNPNVKFVTFLKTDLINKNYPTDKEQFTYYTRDSVQVGVKLFVAYRIIDPKLAIEKLGPTGIDGHIEHVTHVDMARAGQETSLQGIQASSDVKIDAVSQGTSVSENDDNPPAYHQIYLSVWQESVKKQLEKDLKEYGIELVRLNIEEINILNKDIENEMAKRGVTVAKAFADSAAVKMQREVALQEALGDVAVARLRAEQDAETNLISAKNKQMVAELDKETTRINAEAEAGALKLIGETLSNPNLLKYRLGQENASALKETHIHTLFFGNRDSLSQLNSQNSLLPNLAGTSLLTNS